MVDNFKSNQFIISLVNNADEVKTGISLVDDFKVVIFENVADLLTSSQDHSIDLFNKLDFFLHSERVGVPFGKSGFTLSADQE